jgi:hypothetical protein
VLAPDANVELNDFSFDWDSHVYRNAAGIVRPSVTQCMHAAGLYDFSRVDPEVLERKRRIGHSVHRATAEFDREGWVDETWLAEDEILYFRGWQAFRRDFHEIEWVHIEDPMLRTLCGVEVGGTPDREGWLAGAPLVADIKCAATKHSAWRIQTATYAMMRSGRTRCDGVIRMAVQLMPNGKYAIDPHKDDTDASAAIACLQLEAWKRNAGLKEKEELNGR